MDQSDRSAVSEERRKEIFLALVAAQDQDIGVRESRELIAGRYGLSATEMREIERQGLDAGWLPL
jgi:hypothetical protein